MLLCCPRNTEVQMGFFLKKHVKDCCQILFLLPFESAMMWSFNLVHKGLVRPQAFILAEFELHLISDWSLR